MTCYFYLIATSLVATVIVNAMVDPENMTAR